MRKKIAPILISCLTVMLLLSSCSKPEIYEPFFASYINNGIKATMSDPSGNDLLLNKEFISSLSIYQPLSKRKVSYKIEKIEYNEVEKNYLLFNADLPDIKGMKFNADNTEGKGASTVEIIRINGQLARLLCNYKYTSTKTDEATFGGSSIIIESIEYDGKKITQNENTSDIVLNFVVENKVLKLK